VAAVPAPRPHHQHDPWLRIAPGVVTLPPAGQPGHGRTAFVRRQPVRIVDGRFEAGYAGAFQAALEAYDEHLGPLPGPNGDSAGS
jgi:hypothetical protein